MTETPAAPETTAVTPAPQAGKRHLFDSIAVKFIVLLVGYAAPVPVALAIASLWMEFVLHETDSSNNPMLLVKNALDNSGDLPQWALGLALLPSFILFAIVFKSSLGRILSVFSLLLFTGAALYFFDKIPVY